LRDLSLFVLATHESGQRRETVTSVVRRRRTGELHDASCLTGPRSCSPIESRLRGCGIRSSADRSQDRVARRLAAGSTNEARETGAMSKRTNRPSGVCGSWTGLTPGNSPGTADDNQVRSLWFEV
jgi:hypothetical protein